MLLDYLAGIVIFMLHSQASNKSIRPMRARPIAARSMAMNACMIGSKASSSIFNFNSKLNNLPYAIQRLNGTYTRNSAKTVVQDGALVTLSANQFGTSYDDVTGLYGYVPEPAATNLATNSDGAASTYTVSNVVDGTVVPGFNNGIAFSSNSVQRYAYKSCSLSAGVVYAVSVFVVMDDGGAPVVGKTTTTGDFSLVCDWGHIGQAAIVRKIGGSLYRVSSYYTAVTGGGGSACGVIKYIGQSARTFRVTGIQVETGYRATSYIPTTASTASRAADVLSIPLWVNNLKYSGELGNAYWSKTGCSITDNAVGTYDKIVESSGGTFHNIAAANIGAGIVQTLSFSAVPSGRDWVWCQIGTAVAYFNVSTGAIGTVNAPLTATITPDADGGYRCSVTHSNPTTTTLVIGAASGNAGASYSGDGSSGIAVGKVQLEPGATATTYRPTTATLASVANRNIPGFDSAGYTLFADMRKDSATSIALTPIDMSNQSITDRSQIYVTGNPGAYIAMTASSVAQALVSAVVPSGAARLRLAGSFAANNVLGAYNGTTMTADTSATMPSGLSLIHIGNRYDSAAQANSFIFTAGLIPQALTQAQINGLTTL